MKIIPAIDIIDGKCVRLTKGDYAQKKVYSGDPLTVAASFERAGIRHLHLVDLDGARAGAIVNWKVAEEIASKTGLRIDFGGGIKQTADIERLLGMGIAQVNVGSVAVKRPELVKEWLGRFGPEKIILSADVKDGSVRIAGWQSDAATSITDLLSHYTKEGIAYVTCTDIDTDGMMSGPNLALYRKLRESFPQIMLIASGGVASTGDIAALRELGMYGVIIGKAIYENNISLTELSQYGTQ